MEVGRKREELFNFATSYERKKCMLMYWCLARREYRDFIFVSHSFHSIFRGRITFCFSGEFVRSSEGRRSSVLVSCRCLAISLIRTLRLSSPLHGVVLASWEVEVIVPLDPLQELEVVLVFAFDQLLHVDVLERRGLEIFE
jgi:hypothetical protein